jgi:hypothetical protein
MENILAYYYTTTITAVKSFTVLAPGSLPTDHEPYSKHLSVFITYKSISWSVYTWMAFSAYQLTAKMMCLLWPELIFGMFGRIESCNFDI